ncbi:519c7efb-dc61-4b19-971a-6e2b696af8cb-CDS [Sclerotinia trifoliorum]|uniref:519c7efb-dc61-4b19-971a-6e2b696af8cb-CDS n=1 Tax=Sclerotinia trifoliorum TaxID=28548 RepID=A0A8H2ZMC3_9HELO|nr:519c7efb-dc61-4b19-971a-6e2b696af8cb-CDS [Sclerotinia trifoliorum]
MLHLPYPFPTPARKMEYKALPENSSPVESKPSSIMQPFDTIDIEKSAVVSSSGYGTISPYTSKEGGLRTLRKEQGRGIWTSFVQSLVAVCVLTSMGVILVLVFL